MIKTVSLETAKLLKENGFPQETEKWFVPDYETRDGIPTDIKYFLQYGYEGFISKFRYAAPTTDELLEELLYVIDKSRWQLMICKGDNCYGVWYRNSSENNMHRGYIRDQYLPEALAQMWLWLKKEGLIK